MLALIHICQCTILAGGTTTALYIKMSNHEYVCHSFACIWNVIIIDIEFKISIAKYYYLMLCCLPMCK